MNHQLYRLLGLLILVLSLGACDYEPEGIYELETAEPSLPHNMLDGFSFNNTVINDTVYVHFYDLRFYYTCPDDDRELLGASYAINGGPQTKVDHPYSSQFEISLYQLQSGINTITVELLFNSGTGSLADQVRAEYITTQKDISVYKVSSYSNAAASLKSSVVDGALKLEWSPYEYPDYDFDYYEILNHAHIDDVNQSTYICNYYYESLNLEYELNIYAGNRVVGTNAVRVNHPLPQLHYEERANGFYFYWNKSKFYKADFKYVVGGGYYNVWFESSNKNDTTFMLTDVPFGRSLDFNLVFLPTITEYNYRYEGSMITELAAGQPVPVELYNTNRLMDKKTGQVVIYSGNHHTVYNEIQNSIVKEAYTSDYPSSSNYGAPWASSQNGEYIAGHCNSHLLNLNINTLQTERLISLEEMRKLTGLSYRYYFKWCIPDDNGLLYVCLVDNTSGHMNYELIRYNPETNSAIFLTLDNHWLLNTSRPQVSGNGKYIYLRDALFAIDDTQCTPVIESTEVHFIPNKQEAICFDYSGTNGQRQVRYLDLNTLTFDEQRTLEFDQFQCYSLDFKYAVVMVNASDPTPSLINLETGELVKQLDNITAIHDVFLLANDYLYGYSGRRMSLKAN